MVTFCADPNGKMLGKEYGKLQAIVDLKPSDCKQVESRQKDWYHSIVSKGTRNTKFEDLCLGLR